MKIIDLIIKIAQKEIKDKTEFTIKFNGEIERDIYYDEKEENCLRKLKNISDNYPIYDDLDFDDEVVEKEKEGKNNMSQEMSVEVRSMGHVYGVKKARNNNSSSAWERTIDMKNYILEKNHMENIIQHQSNDIKKVVDINFELTSKINKAITILNKPQKSNFNELIAMCVEVRKILESE